LVVDDEEFTLFGISDDGVGGFECDAGFTSDEFGGHDGSKGFGWVLELDISASDDTE
jgi:hypothetical protein